MAKQKQQYQRGFTAQAPGRPDQRPPKLKGGVFNEFDPKVRGALMSPPTSDTQEPRLSRWEGGPVLGPMAKGGLAKPLQQAARQVAKHGATRWDITINKPLTKGKR